MQCFVAISVLLMCLSSLYWNFLVLAVYAQEVVDALLGDEHVHVDLHQNRVYSGVRLYRVYMYDHEHEMGLKETSARMSMPCLRH